MQGNIGADLGSRIGGDRYSFRSHVRGQRPARVAGLRVGIDRGPGVDPG